MFILIMVSTGLFYIITTKMVPLIHFKSTDIIAYCNYFNNIGVILALFNGIMPNSGYLKRGKI